MCELAAHGTPGNPGTPEVPLVPPPGQAVRGRDHRCSSEIGQIPDANGRLPYTLQIRVFLSPPSMVGSTAQSPIYIDRVATATGFQHQRWQCQNTTEEVLAKAFSAISASLDARWNDQLWLESSTAGVDDLTCRLEVQRVQTAAESNLHILILYRPDSPAGGEFRDLTQRGGSPRELPRGEMVLVYPTPQTPPVPETEDDRAFTAFFARQTPDGTPMRHEQNICAHEFGHYLTLGHTCAAAAGGATNAAIAYCEGRLPARRDMLMALGNGMHRNYARL